MTASLIDPELRSKGIFFFGELGGFDSALLVRGLFKSGVFFCGIFFWSYGQGSAWLPWNSSSRPVVAWGGGWFHGLSG